MKPFIFSPIDWAIVLFLFLVLSMGTYAVIHECKKLVVGMVRRAWRHR